MRLVPLTSDYELSDFDCGDSDLNDFLSKDVYTRLMFFDMMDIGQD